MSIESIIAIVLVCMIVLFCAFGKKSTGQRGGGNIEIGLFGLIFVGLLTFLVFSIITPHSMKNYNP